MIMLHLAGRVLPPFREGLGNHQGSVHLCASMNTFESRKEAGICMGGVQILVTHDVAPV